MHYEKLVLKYTKSAVIKDTGVLNTYVYIKRPPMRHSEDELQKEIRSRASEIRTALRLERKKEARVDPSRWTVPEVWTQLRTTRILLSAGGLRSESAKRSSSTRVV